MAFSTPYFTNGGADGWREGCLQAGAMTATQRAVACRRGRREAVSVKAPQPVDAQDDVIFNEPGRRARVARGDGGDPMPRVPFGIRHWGGFADNISCAATGKHPSCQPSASQSLVRVAGIRSGASRKCAPVYADSPTSRRRVGRVVGWPGCQAIAGNFRVRADCFAQWQACRRRHGAKAGRAHDGRGFAGLGSSALARANLNCVHRFTKNLITGGKQASSRARCTIVSTASRRVAPATRFDA